MAVRLLLVERNDRVKCAFAQRIEYAAIGSESKTPREWNRKGVMRCCDSGGEPTPSSISPQVPQAAVPKADCAGNAGNTNVNGDMQDKDAVSSAAQYF